MAAQRHFARLCAAESAVLNSLIERNVPRASRIVAGTSLVELSRAPRRVASRRDDQRTPPPPPPSFLEPDSSFEISISSVIWNQTRLRRRRRRSARDYSINRIETAQTAPPDMLRPIFHSSLRWRVTRRRKSGSSSSGAEFGIVTRLRRC